MARGQAHNFSAQNGEAQRVTSANMPPPRGGRASTKKLWSELPLRSGKDYPQTASDPSQPGGVLLLTRPEAHTGRSLTKFTMAKDTFTSDCTVGLRDSIQTDSPHADSREIPMGSHMLSPNSLVLSPIVHFVLNTGDFHTVLQSKLRRISCAPRWVGARAERTIARSLTTSDGPSRTHTNSEI